MRQKHAKAIYELFEKFIEEFLISKNSILTEDKDILDMEGIEDCLGRYDENFDDSDANFDQKVVGQFDGATIEHKLIFAHAEWLWAFSVQDITQNRKRHYAERTLDTKQPEDINDVFPTGFGNAGQWHTNNKYWEILFNLKCFKAILMAIDDETLQPNVADIKEWFEAACLFVKNNGKTDGKEESPFKNLNEGGQLAQANILLHLSNPDHYERIASNNHKNRIANSFASLIPEEKKNKDLTTDERILLIRKELETLLKETGDDVDFYQERFQKIWDSSITDEGYDKVQALQYKKAIILYGPPGTSKTYSATQLAESLITTDFLSKKSNVGKFLSGDRSYLKDKIHYLQLHPNYTYEDFIVGYQLKNHDTVPVEGILLKKCEAASKDPTKKHVLILDEINRIDLSRLFGEAFSALENRDKPIQLSIDGFELTIPSNLYVIGTMNEIDFSLERIDFALRRRFLWFFYGYNARTLKDIIAFKNEKAKNQLKVEEELERFINNATALNQKISDIPELGKQYQIGHTFFAEIVDIYKGYIEISGLASSRLKEQIYRKEGAAKILWDISIKPMIVSFLGNMNIESRNSILKELKSIYEPK